ncbi:hypothetical protein HF086_014508 [Spodoptera exigua]|uniref:Uncharacterized protein n=1 Tax=Spodoptera exigua TaxID=7107 RepID=A0A922MNJ2_SPOEX|nr:hypothetical protein HF086_014508 [Spodoptera exigua]
MGETTDLKLTQLFSYYILFMISDVLSSHDIKGKNDYRCTPIEVPINDPVHRYSGVRCLNLTRPQTFQTYRCLDNGTTFERIVFQTPLFDLSHIYEYRPGFINQLRTFENGLMKIEEDDGELFPPSDPDSHYCYQNQLPRETRCHKYQVNNVLGSNLWIILLYRHHNQIARELYRLNPSWDDKRLFYTARDINIAISVQIYFYELLPIIFGKKNMIREGLIGRGGFRDLYDENVEPRMSDEYFYGMRWFHMIQKTNMNFNPKFSIFGSPERFKYPFLKYPITTRPKAEVSLQMADRLLGGILFSSDAPTSDLKKGRYFGIQPYVNYKEFCTNRKYTSFADLKDSFSCEHLSRLMEVYEDPKDVELVAALWLEKPVKGGNIPETLYCLLTEQYKRTIKSDRHCNPLMKCNSSRIGKLDLTPWKESA